MMSRTLFTENARSSYTELINRSLPSRQEQACYCISLFSGILGIEIGLERAGFTTALALDFDSDAVDVVEANRSQLGKFPYLLEDITETSAERLLKVSGLREGEIAMLAGGPPCQPFSKAGLRQGIKDDRGLLFKRYLDYLNAIKPQAFLLENVRGLYSSRGGADFKLILEHFEETGYTIYWKVLDSANYGVPQFRQRLFFVGFRDRIRFAFPNETHCDPSELSTAFLGDRQPFVTVEEAIGDLVGKVSGPAHSGRYTHLLKDIPEGLNYSFFTAERGHPNPIFEWRSKFWYFLLKIERGRPSLTLQAYPGNNTGPFHWENRRLAIEELLRLQSFPDWLEISKPYYGAHRLVGNAVPPLLSEAIGLSIMKALQQHERISRLEYVRIREISDKGAGSVNSGSGSGKGKIGV